MQLRPTHDVSVLAIRISAGRSDRTSANRPVPAARSDQHWPVLSAVYEGKLGSSNPRTYYSALSLQAS